MRYQDQFRLFDPDDPAVEILVTGVNDVGEMAGEYVHPGVNEVALYRDPWGTFRPFKVPGARGTEAIKINNSGQIAGSYSTTTPLVNSDPNSRAYRYHYGRVDWIDYPKAWQTSGTGISDSGVVCGQYIDGTGAHGFTWDEGQYTSFDAQGAAITTPLDINDAGDVVGIYVSADHSTHGFLYSGGRTTEIRVMGEVTVPFGINNLGQIVGYHTPTGDARLGHGFLLAQGLDGPATPVDVPDAPHTIALGISDNGRIVGNFENPNA
jgi:probable HAF family extracellular repeat protein